MVWYGMGDPDKPELLLVTVKRLSLTVGVEQTSTTEGVAFAFAAAAAPALSLSWLRTPGVAALALPPEVIVLPMETAERAIDIADDTDTMIMMHCTYIRSQYTRIPTTPVFKQ